MTDRTFVLVGLSEFVSAPDQATAIQAARLALIARGRTPAELLFVDQGLADGIGREYEVVFAERPLGQYQSFGSDGRRYGTGGGRAS